MFNDIKTALQLAGATLPIPANTVARCKWAHLDCELTQSGDEVTMVMLDGTRSVGHFRADVADLMTELASNP